MDSSTKCTRDNDRRFEQLARMAGCSVEEIKRRFADNAKQIRDIFG